MALTSTFFVLGFIAFYLGYIKGKDVSKKKTSKLKFEEFFEYTYEYKINPLVQDVYNLFISEKGMKHFQYDGSCRLLIPILGICIWAENSTFHRELYVRGTDEIFLLYKYGKTIEEMNDSLNIGDKVILDKICKEVIIYSDDLKNTILLDKNYTF